MMVAVLAAAQTPTADVAARKTEAAARAALAAQMPTTSSDHAVFATSERVTVTAQILKTRFNSSR